MPFNLQQLTDKLKRMNKQRLMLLAGIVLSLVAAFVTKTYLDQQRYEIQRRARQELANIQANQAAILVAKDNIPRGKEIKADMLEAVVIPNQYIQPQAVTSLDRIADMTTIAEIAKGEQITLSKLTYNKKKEKLSEFTPVGKRAITVSVDNISALLGMIKAGDYVDVVGVVAVPMQGADGKPVGQVISVPLFQNVLVLAVGQDTAGTPSKSKNRYGADEGKDDTHPLITIALEPREASLAAFVQEQGKLRLLLRSPADSTAEPIQPATWETLMQYISPKMNVSQQNNNEPVPTGYVEIHRGLKKEKVPVYK